MTHLSSDSAPAAGSAVASENASAAQSINAQTIVSANLSTPAAAQTSANEAAFDCDIVIVGAGPVGLALACDLMRRSATAHLSLMLLDARDQDASAKDPRVLALSYGSRILLDPLGWSTEVTPIEKIHISQRGHFGRAEIDRREHDLPALGYVVRYGAVTRALHAGFVKQVSSGGRAQLLENCTVSTTRQDADGVTVQCRETASAATSATATQRQQPTSPPSATATAQMPTEPIAHNLRQLRARLVIHAEGGSSEHAIEQRHSRDYGQTAIVGAVRCSAPLPRVAWERFTSEGPIALLPLAESGAQVSTASPAPAIAQGMANNASSPQRAFDYALVWCQSPENAQRRLALSDEAFLAELGLAFGGRVGHFTQIEGRARFALGLQSRTSLVNGLTAAIGNAAQTLHPVAGQGLNLGLRDAQALATALSQHGPTSAALKAFAAQRRVDRAITIGLTDGLARGFTVDFPPLAALRGLALAALDFLPGTKTVLARQMIFGQRR